MASIQFDVDDPEVMKKLWKVAAGVAASSQQGRVGAGTGGKFIIEAVLKNPALFAKILELLDFEDSEPVPKKLPKGKGRNDIAA